MPPECGEAISELRTLGSLIGVLTEHGDRQAVLALREEGAESWSYSELAGYARRLALGLARAGVSRGDGVVLLAANRPEWIVACLALIVSGVVATLQLGDEACPADLG